MRCPVFHLVSCLASMALHAKKVNVHQCRIYRKYQRKALFMKSEVEIHAERFVKRLDVYVVWFVCRITCKFWFDDIFHFVSALTVLQHESKVQGYSLKEYAFDATTKLYTTITYISSTLSCILGCSKGLDTVLRFFFVCKYFPWESETNC